MARITTVQYTDDLGGAGPATPLNFTINGERYTIDLNKRNTETFLRHMAKYMDAGRKPSSVTARYAERSRQSAGIREWAVANGYTMPERGRIPYAIHEAYRAAQNDA